MFRRLSALFLALLLAGCAAARSGASPAPSPAVQATPAPIQSAETAAQPDPTGCPSYEQVRQALYGPGAAPADGEETCLRNAYALASALCRGDRAAVLSACGLTETDLARAASPAGTQDDRFPFGDLTGLQVDGFAFSGGQGGEPLWLTLSVADPGATPLPRGTTDYAVEFGNGYYVDEGCVQALVPRSAYLPQQGSALQTVQNFRAWVTGQPWQDPGTLPPVSVAFYLSGFAAGRGEQPDGDPDSGIWAGEVLARQAQDAFGTVPWFLSDRSEAAFTQPEYGAVYDGDTDTFALAASPGDHDRNCRMTAFVQQDDGTASLTIARGANSLWMQPDQQVTYTLRANTDGSWAILHADWTGGSQIPEYQIWSASVSLPDHLTLPQSLPLVADLQGTLNGMTWQQAADAFGLPVETLQALNPDPRMNPDGTLNDVILLDPDYALPVGSQRFVRIVLPWEQYQGAHTYNLPTALDPDACIAAAEALDFLWHYNVRTGYEPAELIRTESDGAQLYRAGQGARFTRYDELQTYLESVFTPELAQQYAAGGYEESVHAYLGYLPGGNGELCFGTGERGTSPLVVAQLCTEPKTRPDGSVVFGLLGLERSAEPDSDNTPVQACWHTIRLVPADDGWRVAEVQLAV